jgi:hypothetical protein
MGRGCCGELPARPRRGVEDAGGPRGPGGRTPVARASVRPTWTVKCCRRLLHRVRAVRRMPGTAFARTCTGTREQDSATLSRSQAASRRSANRRIIRDLQPRAVNLEPTGTTRNMRGYLPVPDLHGRCRTLQAPRICAASRKATFLDVRCEPGSRLPHPPRPSQRIPPGRSRRQAIARMARTKNVGRRCRSKARAPSAPRIASASPLSPWVYLGRARRAAATERNAPARSSHPWCAGGLRPHALAGRSTAATLVPAATGPRDALAIGNAAVARLLSALVLAEALIGCRDTWHVVGVVLLAAAGARRRSASQGGDGEQEAHQGAAHGDPPRSRETQSLGERSHRLQTSARPGHPAPSGSAERKRHLGKPRRMLRSSPPAWRSGMGKKKGLADGLDPRVSWWALKVSNLRPPPCEGGALPLS